ncbi:MAG: RNA chaperone Hfq [Nitrospirota bacterium]
METNLLDKMLGSYLSQKTPVTIVLQNNNRISGRIKMFDSYVIIMENQKNEIVYRHAVSSLLPALHADQVHQPREQKGVPAKPASRPAPKAANYPKQAAAKARPSRPAPKAAAAAAASDPGLSNSMKEGLLRWMQEQKAGK